MTKKRLNTLLALGFVIIYILGYAIIFSSCRAYVGQRFTTFAQDFEKNIVEYVNEYNNGEYEDISLQNFVNSIYNESWFEYPTGVAVYSIGKNAELLAENTSHIYVEEIGGIINIEPYLTNDMKQQILDFSKGDYDNRYIIADKLYYNEKDGKIIPIELHLRLQDDFRVREQDLKFSDEKAEKYIDGSENVSRIRVYFDFLYKHSFNIELQGQIKEYLHSDMPIDAAKNYYTAGNSKDGGGAGYSDSMFDSFNILKGKYYLVVNMQQNIVAETLVSDQFNYEAGTFTIIYVLLVIIVFVYANKIYSKNRRINSAKLAFISAAAHELKTPLTIIQNQSEFIIENVSPEKNEEYIKSIYAESQRMDKLVKELLQYNRLASSDSIEKEKSLLSEIAVKETEKYLSLAEQKGVRIITDIADNIIINANANLIALVIDNYLSNAIKHTENGNTVFVTLTNKRFSVFNEGELISEIDKTEIFEVFTKTDKSRHNDGSSGMGLAICKQILELHKYKFGFKNENNGVTFYFEV